MKKLKIMLQSGKTKLVWTLLIYTDLMIENNRIEFVLVIARHKYKAECLARDIYLLQMYYKCTVNCGQEGE